MIISAHLAQDDEEQARQFMRDWNIQPETRLTTITKFSPGQHFHVLGEKFANYEAARQHASEEGYEVTGPVQTTHIYCRDGD